MRQTTGPITRTAPSGEYSQLTMVHGLPPAPRVDRVAHLVAMARGRRVVHVGFVDAGCQGSNRRAGTWLHEHLDRAASALVGIDLDEQGVASARSAGFDAHVVDCTDPAALARADVAPAQLVIAGEVIEHLDSPGQFLEGMHALVVPNGQLVVTTPNAYGLLNVLASLLHREINHPDHVCMFTWRTLTNLAERHGWQVVATAVYVPSVKQVGGRGVAPRAMALAARGVCALERLACRVGRPYAADGLIITFRSTR